MSAIAQFLPKLIADLTCIVREFAAGKVNEHVNVWKEITSDPEVIETVLGAKLSFDFVPQQYQVPRTYSYSESEKVAIQAELDNLLAMKAIVPSMHEHGEFVSNLFSRPKKDNSLRIILNLKDMNRGISYCHFKMDSLRTVIRMMTPNCFMASIDCKHAYYSFSLHPSCRKFCKFIWKGKL